MRRTPPRFLVRNVFVLAFGFLLAVSSLAGTVQASGVLEQKQSSGNGTPALKANPPILNFGSLQIGSSKTEPETLTNSDSASVTISKATVSGAGFSLSGLSLPLTLSPGHSVTFSVTFAPKSSANSSGNITVTSSAPTLTIPLSGTGTSTGQLTAAPAGLNFGSVTVGSSHSLTAALSATGASVTVASVTVSNPEFVLSGLSFPATIAAGQSKSFTVTFSPKASGPADASILFASNALKSPTVEALSGTGTAPPTHSVSLSWDPSTSVVVGYNIYRGNKSGGPYSKLNSATEASTSYQDSDVSAGATYYYVTTAVDGSGKESLDSNQVKAVVPYP